MNNYIEDVDALRRHLGIKKIHILGTSYGSMTALGYSIKYPEYVEKLILVAGSPSYHFLEDAKRNLLERGTPEQIQICEQYLWHGQFKTAQDIQRFFDIMGPLYSVKARTSTGTKPYSNKSEIIFSTDPLNYAFRTCYDKFDYHPDLASVSCKTLILFGEEDWVNDPKYAKIMAENIPQSSLKIYTNFGHAVAIDQHESYVKDVINFIINTKE